MSKILLFSIYSLFCFAETKTHSPAPNTLAFTVNGNERIRIDSGGNVGIGTQNPQSTLQVIGYTQLDTVSSVPPATDCDSADERARIKIDPAAGAVYVCMNSGWVNTANPSAGTIPAGTVAHFNLASCPTGWSAFSSADGRFIVSTGTLGAETYAKDDTGGSATHVLTEAEMPSHNHSIDPPATSSSSAGSHTHSYSGGAIQAQGYGGGNSIYAAGSGNTGSGGAHTHSTDISAFNSATKGSGNAHENRPPYIALLTCQKD